jgi:hypothetical protein
VAVVARLDALQQYWRLSAGSVAAEKPGSALALVVGAGRRLEVEGVDVPAESLYFVAVSTAVA